MFSYEEFLCNVKDGICEYMPERYSNIKVEVMDADMKMHNPYRGLSVSCDDSEVGICMDLSWLYDAMESEEEMEDIIRHVAKMTEEGLDSRPEHLPEIAVDRQSFCEHLLIRLVNRDKYEQIIDRIPHRSFFDMVITYTLISQLPNGHVYGTLVTDDMIEEHGIYEAELYEIAIENSKQRFPIEICKSDFKNDEIFLAGITCGVGGATCMLYDEFIDMTLPVMEGDFFILPVSTDFVFLVKDGEVYDKESIRELSGMLNGLFRKEDDYLTGEVFFCDVSNRYITRLGDHVN